ncbi:hypothetical protein FHS57_006054 [Runella defluvii]|uniref:Uncharacterized protein n=1 Tax=Runella defluvii TaxID=370973 RepID=A0A7W6ETM7_9BACT|nr:hypothetical protein [Runella defluvii]MBB3842025.1 hypothetical protein [Runella defluvii]
MIKETTPIAKNKDKYIFLRQFLEQQEKELKLAMLARTMKAQGIGFLHIFEATGLQPEIIQSL